MANSPQPLTRRELDAEPCLGCGRPHAVCGSAHEIIPACHPSGATAVVYQHGTLVLLCAVCQALVVAIEVAGPEYVEPVVIDVVFDA